MAKVLMNSETYPWHVNLGLWTHRYQVTWFHAEFKVCHLNAPYLQFLFSPAFELETKGKTGEGERCSRGPEHL